ncbi:hypothetical protein C1646_729552, partial [Rhizophagus diaphanus]
IQIAFLALPNNGLSIYSHLVYMLLRAISQSTKKPLVANSLLCFPNFHPILKIFI